MNGEQRPGLGFSYVHDDVNEHILRMLEGTFSLEVAPVKGKFSPASSTQSDQCQFKYMLSVPKYYTPSFLAYANSADSDLGYALYHSIK